ncbi:MAG: RNA polymerase sigma factor [Cyclobacteriaceae bacterium]
MSYKQDPSELELVYDCLQQDRQSQKKLYDKYKDAMYTILYRMLNNEDDAADALQEAFIQVFRGLSSYKGVSSLGAWIKTIVVRTALARRRHQIHFDEIDERSQKIEPIHWDSNLTGEYLDHAIRALSDGYRSIFLMIEVEGYTHRETAEMLGITEGTSKSQLFHAKKALQKQLKEVMYG